MATLQDMANKLKNINLIEIVDNAIDQTKANIVDLNKYQLLHGIATDNTLLGRYTPAYAKRKAKIKSSQAPYGIYDFSLYGSFQDDMYAADKGDIIEIGSIDIKEPFLEKYGRGANRVFGLTDDNKTEYSETILKPVIQEKIKSYLGI